MAGVVKLTEAASELEAAEICGYLATHGIEATYDKGGIAQPGLGGPGEAFVGRQEILVHADDAERAAALLRELQS